MQSITPSEVAKQLGVSRVRVTQLIQAGELKLTREVPRLISPASLAKLIERRKAVGIQPGKAGARGRPKKINSDSSL